MINALFETIYLTAQWHHMTQAMQGFVESLKSSASSIYQQGRLANKTKKLNKNKQNNMIVSCEDDF